MSIPNNDPKQEGISRKQLDLIKKLEDNKNICLKNLDVKYVQNGIQELTGYFIDSVKKWTEMIGDKSKLNNLLDEIKEGFAEFGLRVEKINEKMFQNKSFYFKASNNKSEDSFGELVSYDFYIHEIEYLLMRLI